jgi:regulator of protease activity HflC (stomatin/prohibitin superfamily)
VEIRDVRIPAALQDAMSRQAQAERERQARIILGESETQIAAKFMEAAAMYATNPIALHLRAMNMLYEGMKDKGSLIIVPSSALETMNLGVTDLAALKTMAEQAGAAPPSAPTPALGQQPSIVPPTFPGMDI